MIQDIGSHRFHNEYDPGASAEADSPVLCFDAGGILVREIRTPEGTKIRFPTAQEVFPDVFPNMLPGGERQDLVFAFRMDETAYFLDLSGRRCQIPGFEYREIRKLRRLCDNADGMIVFTGIHLFQWYRQSRFCGCCGQLTRHDPAERAMDCPSCGHKIYPRLQPAVIVGVTSKDRLLVTQYREGYQYYALVAGFAEIGETFEETVRREVMEETGLKVKNIRYYKSQPWGIAQDLLAGFYCEADGDDTIRMDEQELRLALWKRREEIELQPDSFSLTNEMMKRFKDGEVPV
ncbi:MAG: NAD(+) diphosphatase [Parasporobacterium sp.]|nr:NAD(+) diphosphatase [Parasporobacterium sp.]